ncbi:MAG: SIR2 family protein [Pseudomonadota bacterium]
MAKVLSSVDVAGPLVYYLQSGNLNFVIGSGASYPAIALAGNIESELDKLLDAGNSTEANVLALDFVQGIEFDNQVMTMGSEAGDWKQTLKHYSDFLLTLDQILFRRKSNLLPRQANIFTTNYDTFFEEAAGRAASIILNDGFDRTSSQSGNFKFAPERYFDRTYRSGAVYTRQAEVPSINLIKLHGSLTWRKTNTGIRYTTKNIEKIDLTGEFDVEQVENSLSKRALVLPTAKKHGSTVMDRTYYDLLRLYANSLEAENAILVAFGFSFCDKHLREVTLRALRNPTSQMIVFAFNADAVAWYEEIFESTRNIIVVAPPENEVIDFEALTNILGAAIASEGEAVE